MLLCLSGILAEAVIDTSSRTYHAFHAGRRTIDVVDPDPWIAPPVLAASFAARTAEGKLSMIRPLSLATAFSVLAWRGSRPRSNREESEGIDRVHKSSRGSIPGLRRIHVPGHPRFCPLSMAWLLAAAGFTTANLRAPHGFRSNLARQCAPRRAPFSRRGLPCAGNWAEPASGLWPE
jgi:hypothetical protein